MTVIEKTNLWMSIERQTEHRLPIGNGVFRLVHLKDLASRDV